MWKSLRSAPAAWRAVANCGRCADYASCEKIEGFIKMVLGVKAVLDEIAAGRE